MLVRCSSSYLYGTYFTSLVLTICILVLSTHEMKMFVLRSHRVGYLYPLSYNLIDVFAVIIVFNTGIILCAVAIVHVHEVKWTNVPTHTLYKLWYEYVLCYPLVYRFTLGCNSVSVVDTSIIGFFKILYELLPS